MNAVSLDAIVRAAAAAYGLSPDVLRQRDRSARPSLARQAAMWLAWKLTLLDYTAIGAGIGGRDRTTIRHGIAVIEARRRTGERLQAKLEQIEARLRAVRDCEELSEELPEDERDPIGAAYRVLQDPASSVSARIAANAVLAGCTPAENPLYGELAVAAGEVLRTRHHRPSPAFGRLRQAYLRSSEQIAVCGGERRPS